MFYFVILKLSMESSDRHAPVAGNKMKAKGCYYCHGAQEMKRLVFMQVFALYKLISGRPEWELKGSLVFYCRQEITSNTATCSAVHKPLLKKKKEREIKETTLPLHATKKKKL